MINKNISKISISAARSIKEALSLMALNKSKDIGLPAGIVLVTGELEKLLGIATDGDIRRSLAAGVALDTPIEKMMNRRPFLIEAPKSNNEIINLVTEKIKKENWHKDRLSKIIIVDKKKRVLDLVSFHDLLQKGDIRSRQIGVVGLGYVGLTLALTSAELGFKVKGFDINPGVTKSLKLGRPHFFESGLADILKNNIGNNFNVTGDFKGKDNCDVYFVAVGTPLSPNKKPDLKQLESASQIVGSVLKMGDIVILRSTVPVGTTRQVVIPILEKESKLKSDEDFFVAFAPERTVEGKALEELKTLPQVIGGLNWASADLAASIFNHLTHSMVLVDSLEEAEMVKLVNNTYRDVVFSFANELSLVCNKLGINTRRVIEAANRGYNRSQVPMPSPGVGGICLEKDPHLFIESAKSKNYRPLLARDSREISVRMVDFIAKEIIDFIKDKNKPKVFIIGLAFKGQPVTSDVRGSAALNLIGKLKDKAVVYGYDPAVNSSDLKDSGLKLVNSPAEGFRKADAVVVMNNNPDFEKLDIKRLLKNSNEKIFFFDTWAVFEQNDLGKLDGVVYKHL